MNDSTDPSEEQEFALFPLGLVLFPGGRLPELHQCVDEETIALGCRNSTRRRVRSGNQAGILEISHHVTNSRGAQRKPALARQCS